MEDVVETYDVSILKTMLEEVLHKVPPAKRKYVHIKTINNFLYHFDSLLLSQKELVYTLLHDHLVFLLNIEDLEDIEGKQSGAIFHDHIYPIAKVYDDALGFSINIPIYGFLLWMFMIDTLMYLIGALYYFYIFIFIFFIILYSRVYKLKRAKKLYGNFY